MLLIIIIYFVNFLIGKSKNYRLATAWYTSHRELLERNFFIVGDDGTSLDLKKVNTNINQDEESSPKNDDPDSESSSSSSDVGKLIKDSENSYGLWCTGRQTCDGMLAQLKLVKRQDLVNGVLMQLIKPQSDQIILSVEYPTQRDTLDSFVFCLTNKKQSKKLFEDYQDLSSYTVEKRLLPTGGNGASGGNGGDVSFSSIDYKYGEMLSGSVAAKYSMLNECSEVPNAILDRQVCAFLNKYPGSYYIYIFFKSL